MSNLMLNLAWKTQCRSSAAKLVLVALADRAHDDGYCWPGIPNLAKQCDLSEQGARNQIRHLQSDGLLEVELSKGGRIQAGKPKTNRYRLTLHAVERSAGQPPTPLGTTLHAVEGQPPTPLTPTPHSMDPIPYDPSLDPPLEPSTPFIALIPDNLKVPNFLTAWREWVADRKARRNPISERAAKLQLKGLATFGTEGAIASINQSIANGWKGLFPPKDKPRNKTPDHSLGVF